MPCRFWAIVGLQFLTEAAFGFMSPIIYIVLTEVRCDPPNPQRCVVR
jgi:hypothetical protein